MKRGATPDDDFHPAKELKISSRVAAVSLSKEKEKQSLFNIVCKVIFELDSKRSSMDALQLLYDYIKFKNIRFLLAPCQDKTISLSRLMLKKSIDDFDGDPESFREIEKKIVNILIKSLLENLLVSELIEVALHHREDDGLYLLFCGLEFDGKTFMEPFMEALEKMDNKTLLAFLRYQFSHGYAGIVTVLWALTRIAVECESIHNNVLNKVIQKVGQQLTPQDLRKCCAQEFHDEVTELYLLAETTRWDPSVFISIWERLGTHFTIEELRQSPILEGNIFLRLAKSARILGSTVAFFKVWNHFGSQCSVDDISDTDWKNESVLLQLVVLEEVNTKGNKLNNTDPFLKLWNEYQNQWTTNDEEKLKDHRQKALEKIQELESVNVALKRDQIHEKDTLKSEGTLKNLDVLLQKQQVFLSSLNTNKVNFTNDRRRGNVENSLAKGSDPINVKVSISTSSVAHSRYYLRSRRRISNTDL